MLHNFEFLTFKLHQIPSFLCELKNTLFNFWPYIRIHLHLPFSKRICPEYHQSQKLAFIHNFFQQPGKHLLTFITLLSIISCACSNKHNVNIMLLLFVFWGFSYLRTFWASVEPACDLVGSALWNTLTFAGAIPNMFPVLWNNNKIADVLISTGNSQVLTLTLAHLKSVLLSIISELLRVIVFPAGSELLISPLTNFCLAAQGGQNFWSSH